MRSPHCCTSKRAGNIQTTYMRRKERTWLERKVYSADSPMTSLKLQRFGRERPNECPRSPASAWDPMRPIEGDEQGCRGFDLAIQLLVGTRPWKIVVLEDGLEDPSIRQNRVSALVEDVSCWFPGEKGVSLNHRWEGMRQPLVFCLEKRSGDPL